SVIAGVSYSFSPFMFAHLCHLQVLSAWAIPLSFLFLQRFFKTEKTMDLLYFSLFYLIQILSNGYYGLYLTLFAGMFIAYHLTLRHRSYGIHHQPFSESGSAPAMRSEEVSSGMEYDMPSFSSDLHPDAASTRMILFKVLLFLGAAWLLASPFFYQYLAVRKEMGFSRETVFGADLVSYFMTPPVNMLYGGFSKYFDRAEGQLFPGFTILLLAFIGICSLYHPEKSSAGKIGKESTDIKDRLINFGLWFFITCAIMIFMMGGIQMTFLGFTLKASTPERVLLGALILALLKFIRNNKFREKILYSWTGLQTGSEMKMILLIGLFAFVFSLGPEIRLFDRAVFSWGPYQLLQRFIPGFDGLRVSGRFFIFVSFSLSLFSIWGLKRIEERVSKNRVKILNAAILFLVISEYLSVPVPLHVMPVKESIPPVYRWLKNQDKKMTIIELPLPSNLSEIAQIECPRIYYSCYHGKNIFNGFSGYIPPLYQEMMRRLKYRPLKDCIRDFNRLGIEYILFHFGFGKYSDRFRRELSGLGDELESVIEFKEDRVYRIRRIKEEMGKSPFVPGRVLARENEWRIFSNINPEKVCHAIDGDMGTSWNVPHVPGIHAWIELNFNRTHMVAGFSLKQGKNGLNYPEGYKVEISKNGVEWHDVANQDTTLIPIRDFLKPAQLSVTVNFQPVSCQWLRITNTGSDPDRIWSVSELEIYKTGSS
ncbi:MAG: discoidin domain-containing protein, partial [Candidatus Aureabacteria bacterium]|nr:discoidin domain-containing protein [Candidatus Auribacterota bacterium]